MENEIEQLLADNTLKDIICSMPCDHPINVELERQLAKARREGWEQGKREAFEIARTTPIGYIQTTIAAMEYKGESK